MTDCRIENLRAPTASPADGFAVVRPPTRMENLILRSDCETSPQSFDGGGCVVVRWDDGAWLQSGGARVRSGADGPAIAGPGLSVGQTRLPLL